MTHALKDYAWRVAAVMASFLAIMLIAQYHYDAKFQLTPLYGESMHDTIPSGNLVLWMRYLHPPGNLRSGQIGCFNSSIAALAWNRSEYLVCHWLNNTVVTNQLPDGIGIDLQEAYEFHSDGDCTQERTLKGLETKCSVQQDFVLPGDVKGRVLGWADPYLLVGVLIALLVGGFYVFEKRSRPKEPVRPLPVPARVQHPGLGTGSGPAENRV